MKEIRRHLEKEIGRKLPLKPVEKHKGIFSCNWENIPLKVIYKPLYKTEYHVIKALRKLNLPYVPKFYRETEHFLFFEWREKYRRLTLEDLDEKFCKKLIKTLEDLSLHKIHYENFTYEDILVNDERNLFFCDIGSFTLETQDYRENLSIEFEIDSKIIKVSIK